MFQKSVLSGIYTCFLQIPGNWLIQTLLIDSKSRDCAITPHHGIGDSRNHPPIHSKEKNKTSISTNFKTWKESHTKHELLWSCAGPLCTRGVGQRRLSFYWGSPQPKGQGLEHRGVCRVVCRWYSTGKKGSCQPWRYQSTPLTSCVPTT